MKQPIYTTPKVLLVSLSLIAFTYIPLPAQVLFDNGAAPAPDTESFNAPADTGATSIMAGNVFTPTMSGTADEISFAGFYSGSASDTDSFTLTLYSTSSGAPATILAESSVTGLIRSAAGGAGILSYEQYTYSGAIALPFQLSSATTYYLGISDTTTPFSDFYLEGPSSPGPATIAYSYISGSGFSGPSDGSFSFQLSQVAQVPEPATWLLLAGGCSLSLIWRRRISQR